MLTFSALMNSAPKEFLILSQQAVATLLSEMGSPACSMPWYAKASIFQRASIGVVHLKEAKGSRVCTMNY
jgi:hypothetical protein